MNTPLFKEDGIYHINALLAESSLSAIQQQLRTQLHDTPEQMHLRWRLFQVLCLQGEWQSALKQLQTCAAFEFITEQTAQALRSLIRAEQARTCILSGQMTPLWYQNNCPAWATGLLEACQLTALNTTESIVDADMIRQDAMAHIPDIAGETHLGTFTWISDSDSRLGPVIELVIAGQLQLVPLNQISHMQWQAPQGLLDLIWTPVKVTMQDGVMLDSFMPTRYVISSATSDQAKLSRVTEWLSEGETTVIGTGQKVWITDQGEISLCDLRHLRIYPQPAVS